VTGEKRAVGEKHKVVQLNINTIFRWGKKGRTGKLENRRGLKVRDTKSNEVRKTGLERNTGQHGEPKRFEISGTIRETNSTKKKKPTPNRRIIKSRKPKK